MSMHFAPTEMEEETAVAGLVSLEMDFSAMMMMSAQDQESATGMPRAPTTLAPMCAHAMQATKAMEIISALTLMSVQRLLVCALLSLGTKVARTCQELTPASATVVTKATDRHVRTSMNVKSTSAAHLLIVQICQAHIFVLVLMDLWGMAWHA